MFFCKKTCISWVLKRALHAQKIHYTKTIQGNCLPVANLRDFLQKNQLFKGKNQLFTGNSNALQIPTHQPYSTKFNLYRYIIYVVCPLYTHKIHWGRIYAFFCNKSDISWPLTDISWPLKNFFRHPANPLPDWARGHFEKRAKFC